MNNKNIGAISYSVIFTILIIIISYFVNNGIKYTSVISKMFTNKLMFSSIIAIVIQILLLIFAVQISAIIHELGHFSQSKQTDQDYVNIGNFYIPYIGFFWASDVNTFGSIGTTRFKMGIIGFLLQFIYLTIMTLIIFKGATTPLAIVLFGFISYLFIYASIMYDLTGNDIELWVKPNKRL